MAIHSDEYFMSLAIAEAMVANKEGDMPFGAVVVCSGEVIGKAHAQDNRTQDITAHAELQAVQQACKKLGTKKLVNCVIYCTNEPCIMCGAAIFQANIPKVIIGISREDIPNILRARKLHISDLAEDSGYPIEIVRGISKDEILKLFKDIKKK
jgi:tRNA(adenine34) deaminase